MQESLGFGGAIKRGAIAGLVVAMIGALALGAYAISNGGLPGMRDQTSVLVMVGLPDENGDLVAQAIARIDGIDGTSPSIFSVDPTSAVTVAGTSFNHLRDAYAFGGGARVAEAYSRLYTVVLPYVDFGPKAIEAAVAKNGGVAVTIPADMSVFDGDQLYTFTSGPARLSAEEMRAALNGSAYLAPEERRALLGEIETALAGLCAEYPGGLQAGIDAGDISSDLTPDGVEAMSRACARLQ